MGKTPDSASMYYHYSGAVMPRPEVQTRDDGSKYGVVSFDGWPASMSLFVTADGARKLIAALQVVRDELEADEGCDLAAGPTASKGDCSCGDPNCPLLSHS